MSLIDNYPETFTLLRAAESQDDTGGTEQNFSALLSGVPCRFQPRSRVEALAAGRTGETETAVMYCPAEISGAPIGITQKDRVIVDRIASRTWLITGLTDPNLEGRYLRVELEERK